MTKPSDPTSRPEVENETTNSTKTARRRALLGAISAIGASQLPGQWSRPVVDHVLLPAHAAKSNGSFDIPLTDCDITCTSAFTVFNITDGDLSRITFTTTTAVTCLRQPGGAFDSASGSLSTSQTGEFFPASTSESNSISFSFSSSSLCGLNFTELVTAIAAQF